MCLIDQKYIIPLTAVPEKSLQIHMGIKEVIVVSDDAVSEQAQIQSEQAQLGIKSAQDGVDALKVSLDRMQALYDAGAISLSDLESVQTL